MINWFLNFFKKESKNIFTISKTGNDKFVNLYYNGNKTNVYIMVFCKEDIENLKSIKL